MGRFFYASGKLYRYELHQNRINAILLFENLPCTGVTNVTQERTTGDFFISTKSKGFCQIKKKRFGVVNLLNGEPKPSGAAIKIGNNIVYALSLWDEQHLFTAGYRVAITGNSAAQAIRSDSDPLSSLFFFTSKTAIIFG